MKGSIPLIFILSLMSCSQPIAENWYGDWYYMPEDQSINITTYQTSLEVLDQEVTLSVDCDEDPPVRVGIHTDILSDFDGVSGQVTIVLDNGEPDAQYWRYWRYFTDDAYYKTSIVSQRPYTFVARLLEAERLTIHFHGTDDTTLSAT